MVPMTMGQNDTEKAATGGGKPIDVGQRCGSKVLGVQRKTEIEQDSAPLALQLDTSAANLPRPPMDSQFHYATSPPLIPISLYSIEAPRNLHVMEYLQKIFAWRSPPADVT
ncbi:hypothetical protein BJA5080_00932 [Bradyrhizobium diazoefficiens SEMIA 5080]|uniref:Uncharacterized protein n=1 Tax=Bradyrhizobium diazoefficiens SEMIA 5080 TaxID=754504 RepID=A0A837CFX9_9BRAD|nr:hypothetical protein BJA5080_00932 [Bradyrhizobium diazoefficiens SEMIA 5080]